MRHIVYIFLFLSASIVAQQDRVNDSLKQVIQNTKTTDSLRCDSYIRLIRHYKRNNEDSCKVYLKKLATYGETNTSPLALYHYHRLKAGYFGLFVGPDDDTFEFIDANLQKALTNAEATASPELVVKTYSRLGQEYVRVGKTEEALAYVEKGEHIAVKENLWWEQAYIYGQLGELYNLGFNKTEIALQYLLKSDSIYKTNNYQGDKRGSTLSYIGDVYLTFDNIQEARAYQEEALSLFTASNNVFKQKFILGKLASIEAEDKNYDTAIAYMLDCIAYYKDKKFLIKEGISQIILSDVYFDSGNIDKALESGERAIRLNKQNKHNYGLFVAYVNQAEVLYENANYTKSTQYALEAERLGLQLDLYSDLKQVYELLYLNSEKREDYKNAYNYAREFKKVSDTLVARQNITDAKELEAQYKNAQQQQEISLLQSQNQLAAAKRKNQRNLLFGIIGFSAIALLVLFVLYRNRKKTATKLIELDAAKSTFFQNISHEFRTPLSLISGPIEKRLEDTSMDEADRNELEMIHRNSNRLMDLINQILDISKIESKALNLKVSQGNLGALLKSLAASFQYKAEEKQINYTIEVDAIEAAWFDKDAIEKIVTNLLSNAFKFTPENGLVSLRVKQQHGKVLIDVENSGHNFTKAEIETIFNRFSRFENKDDAMGSGIGLSLVQELTNLTRGEIQVKNSSENAVIFSVALPIEKADFLDDEIVKTAVAKTKVSDDEVAIATEIDNGPVLLVVDDNEDIRSFIKESFKETYQIIEAHDGKDGMQKALEHIPDIIISDIMMPNLSGIELCAQLKQDERTSHIPVVLLTAKVDENSQHQGLETGADDYVLKPFSVKLLSSRVNNLVKSRIQLRERYSNEVVLKPQDISVNSIDERFVEKIKEILDENMTDDSFSIEAFSKELSMSRMQLHRKLKALTGLSASEFLRAERLKLAISLFKDASLNINEICYQSGFNSPSYFSKCFKETYGILPSEYREKR